MVADKGEWAFARIWIVPIKHFSLIRENIEGSFWDSEFEFKHLNIWTFGQRLRELLTALSRFLEREKKFLGSMFYLITVDKFKVSSERKEVLGVYVWSNSRHHLRECLECGRVCVSVWTFESLWGFNVAIGHRGGVVSLGGLCPLYLHRQFGGCCLYWWGWMNFYGRPYNICVDNRTSFIGFFCLFQSGLSR